MKEPLPSFPSPSRLYWYDDPFLKTTNTRLTMINEFVKKPEKPILISVEFIWRGRCVTTKSQLQVEPSFYPVSSGVHAKQ